MGHRWIQINFIQFHRQWAQDGAGPGSLTSTLMLEMPVDCVLAGHQLYYESGRTWELHAPRLRSKPVLARGTAPRRLSESVASFTVRSGKRGYD